MSPAKPGTIMCVTAHPADPFDCAAGTLALHARAGGRVVIVSITHGARSHAPKAYGGGAQEQLDDAAEQALLDQVVAMKLKEFQAACDVIGAEMVCLKHSDEPLVISREVILELGELYREHKPDLLITHHKAELNNHDHPAAGEMALRAVTSAGRWLAGSRRGPHAIGQVYFFGMQFRRLPMVYHAAIPLPATHVVDIEPTIEKKIACLKAFGSQSYAGLDYASDEYHRKRVAAMEGHWGLVHGMGYAEEFIALHPHKCRQLA